MTTFVLAEPQPVATPSLVSEAQVKRAATRKRRQHWKARTPEDFICYPRYQRLSYFEEMTLVRRAQEGDKDARNRLWAQHARLAYSVVNEFSVPEALLADAVQEGLLGIHRAIEKFEVDRLGAFSTYAWHWVRQRIQRFLERHRLTVPLPAHFVQDFHGFRKDRLQCLTNSELSDCDRRWRESAGKAYPSIRDILRISEATPWQEIARRDHPAIRPSDPAIQVDHSALHGALRKVLNSRQFQILELRYGLNGEPELTLEQIGQRLGITRERVRQIQQKAENRVRTRLARFAQRAAGLVASDAAE